MLMDRRHLLKGYLRKSELVVEALSEAKRHGIQLTEKDFRRITKKELRQAFLENRILQLLQSLKKTPQIVRTRKRLTSAEKGRQLAQNDPRYWI